MSLIVRAAEAGILQRAVDIVLATAERTTQQMRSMQGQLKADQKPQEPKKEDQGGNIKWI